MSRGPPVPDQRKGSENLRTTFRQKSYVAAMSGSGEDASGRGEDAGGRGGRRRPRRTMRSHRSRTALAAEQRRYGAQSASVWIRVPSAQARSRDRSPSSPSSRRRRRNGSRRSRRRRRRRRSCWSARCRSRTKVIVPDPDKKYVVPGRGDEDLRCVLPRQWTTILGEFQIEKGILK